MGFRCLILAGLLALLGVPALAQVITTIAGNTWVFPDGLAAVNTPFDYVSGLATDSAGNFYVTDHTNYIVVKVNPAGISTIVAGNRTCGDSGDGGPATSASLCHPHGLAIDRNGNLYIADGLNNRVRKVAPNGIITTVAGTGVHGTSGDSGLATNATLSYPEQLALDTAGNLFISGTDDYRVRKVTPAGIITTVAGTGVRGFSGDGGAATAAQIDPRGLAVDAAGNLLIASNGRVRQVTPAGIITTYAGGGIGSAAPNNIAATAANLDGATGLALDAAGNLLVTLGYRDLICRISVGGIVTTVAGNGSEGFSGDGGQALAASFNIPESLAVDASGNLYIADTRNARVRRVDGAGVISTVAGNQGYRFSGDGGPAINAYLQDPDALAVDATGNLYIADTNNVRIRKITPSGIISTFAGNGSEGNTGDGGPATAARIFEPGGLTFDSAGNLYFSQVRTDTVRKITPDGIITTVAGTGIGGGGFSGDDGPATAARLTDPRGLAVDSAGNLYIADAANNRIRKVSAATGIITTIAGTGASGFSGDGGPALAATFQGLSDLVVDAGGNLLVSDSQNNRIRKITPSGIISTVAGTGVEGFSGDGGPATSAALAHPSGLALDGAGNLYIVHLYGGRIRRVTTDGIINTVAGGGTLGDGNLATQAALPQLQPEGIAVDSSGNLYITTGDLVRRVLGVPPSFSVAPLRIDITSPSGTPGAVTQQIIVSSVVSGLPWTIQTTTQSGGSWLAATPVAGVVPGTASISVNPASLSPGIYRGSVVVTIPQAGPATQTIPVTLSVTPAIPAQLKVQPSALTFASAVGGTTRRQTISIGNAGAGTLSWTAEAATASGGNWLSVDAASGTATFVLPASLAVSVNVSGLAAGVYSGSVTVRSAETSQIIPVPVTLSVVVPTQTILLSQSGLLFTGVEGGRFLPPQTFGVVNTGLVSSMSWTTEVSTLSGGSWLSATPLGGVSLAGSTQIPLVSVFANVSGLRAGSYSGQVRIRATGADNSPQIVTVILNVLPPGSNPNATARPSGLIFVARAGGASPPSQSVLISTASPANVEFAAGATSAGSWLTAAPTNGRISADASKELVVRPTLGSLGPGVYRGSVTLLFSDNSPPQVVDVLFLVIASGTDATPLRLGAGDGCTPKSLLAVSRTLSGNFASPAGWPISVEAQVIDDCGNIVPNATVIASFSNGDPPIALASLGNGAYSGTWRPLNSGSQVVTTVRAILPPLTAAQFTAQGQVAAGVSAPTVYAGGVVNAASYASGSVVAPGSIVAVFGSSMAQTAGGASSLPLPTVLNGASVTVGGIASPLFYSSTGQVNAQIPVEVAPNTRPQVVLSTTNAFAVPETITIADVRPGIFTANSQGTGQGIVTHPDTALVDSNAPAAAGDVVVVYCNGLGATNPAVTSGRPAPSAEPLARAVVVPSATVGGRAAGVQFAGLVPGFVGLFQVNVQIPAGISAGAAVPLVLIQNGVASNTVTVAIK